MHKCWKLSQLSQLSQLSWTLGVEQFKQGNHLGEFNPEAGEQTKPAKPGRKVEKQEYLCIYVLVVSHLTIQMMI
jgi:hypothetical protein